MAQRREHFLLHFSPPSPDSLSFSSFSFFSVDFQCCWFSACTRASRDELCACFHAPGMAPPSCHCGYICSSLPKSEEKGQLGRRDEGGCFCIVVFPWSLWSGSCKTCESTTQKWQQECRIKSRKEPHCLQGLRASLPYLSFQSHWSPVSSFLLFA